MADLADLYPGFASRTVATAGGRIFARVGGSGPPLLLAHGFPQTAAMWHRVAPRLAARFTVVVPDLRGYGWSSAPASRDGQGYTKRAMGADLVAVMADLGFARFRFAGHDRGARVGYRLALDQPGRIERLALLDILPTAAVWRAREADPDVSPHWPWLARAEPEPERAIAADPDGYFEGLMARWSGSGLGAFAPEAMAHYRAGWNEPSRIHAMCEDYRAGADQDVAADRDDAAAGRTIASPVLVVASRRYLARPGSTPPLAAWRDGFAPGAEGVEVDTGHFMAEEDPDATGAALSGFL